MIIVGVDPGAGITGYGVVAQGDGAVSLVECGVIRTNPAEPLAERLRDIFEGMSEVLARHRPAMVAVERVFHGKNARTSLILGHARGAILLAATLKDIRIAEYSPAEVKTAVTGTGRATKEQMQYMVQRLLRLRTVPTPADAADAIAVALCHCNGAALLSRLEGRLA